MSEKSSEDWNPFSESVAADQRAAFDAMRERCPVAYSDAFGWTLFRHKDIEQVLHDPDTFSNKVSTHLSAPNGMDPPEHGEYRRLIEPYFAPEPVSALAPRCRIIAAELIDQLLPQNRVEFIQAFAQPFAARAQCAFLGWPDRMADTLSRWALKAQEATRKQDRKILAETADEFTTYVLEMLEEHRRQNAAGTTVTARLLRERVNGRPLNNEELVSILRNWTVGEVGTLSAALGILTHFLVNDPALQQRLRDNPELLTDANEEILRLHGPLLANRRRATRDVDIGGRTIKAGERVQINWIAANRDPQSFAQSDTFQIDRDQSRNLLWGSGIHVCPGAPLARMDTRWTRRCRRSRACRSCCTTSRGTSG